MKIPVDIHILPYYTMAMKKLYTIKKYGGDDSYSWAVFRKGCSTPVCTGCMKREAQYHAKQLEKSAAEKATETK